MKRHLAFLLSLLLGAGSALAQSGETINQLSPGAALSGTEQIPIYQGSNPAVTTTPSAVAAYAVASPRSGLNGWVNIRDPAFGATGNGTTDDTVAIQSAIDYVFAHNLTGVYCPAGYYKTSNTIWLDPPNNTRATTWTGTGYFSAGSFAISSTTTGTFGGTGAYISGVGLPSTGPTIVISGTGPYTVNNSFTLGSSGSPVSLTATTPSNPTSFGFSMSFFGDPAGGSGAPGCIIRSTFNNAVAFMVGSGQGMRVSDFAIYGPSNGYNGNQSPYGVGIGLSGGSGGSHANLIDNVDSENFYTLFETDANGGCCLNDSNTFRKIQGNNGYYGIRFLGTQSDINDIYSPTITATVGIHDEVSRQVNVYGGNISSSSNKNNSFGISSVSTLSSIGITQGTTYYFTAVVASPDAYIPNVYNSYTVATAHFGVVPLTMTGWNAGTGTGTFQIWLPWLYANYGGAIGAGSKTALQSDIQAVSTIYAAERLVTAQGMGIALDGLHLENGGCTSLFLAQSGWGGATTNEIKNMFINYDPSETGASTANFYCQQTFPFIGQELDGSGTLILNGGNYGEGLTSARVLLKSGPLNTIKGSGLDSLWLNESVYDTYAYSQLGGYGQFATEARGIGTWDTGAYFVSSAYRSSAYNSAEWAGPTCGYEPCPWSMPNMDPSSYSSFYGGALGALASYPPVACRTVLRSVGWNSAALTHLFWRSASCPGYSWGQSLTDATVGETVTWSYMAGSDVLYLDAKSFTFMFPGLGIIINDGGDGPLAYIVTGVYAQLGYVTVIGAWSTTTHGGAPLQGTAGTVYSCSSSCTIGQAPFAWTTY